MFGNINDMMLDIFKEKRVKVFIGSHGSDKTIVLEGIITDYKMAGGFWVLDDKFFVPAASVLYIELV